MKALFSWFEKISFIMHLIAGGLLVLMMLITMGDVLSRLLFNLSNGSLDLTFYGGIELVSYTLLYAVLFSLPYSVARGQVIVDLFTEGMSAGKKEFLVGFYSIGFGLLGSGMVYGWYEAAHRVAENGETTQDLLIPMAYIYGIAAFAALILAIRGFLVALEHISHAWSKS